MRLSLSAVSFSIVAMLFLSSSFLQNPTTSEDLIAEGVIVAFQKDSRYPVMPYTTGIATRAEFWIVRIDKWHYDAGKLADKKYILVEYRLYMRGITDCEINANKLRFTLRQKREDEHTDCSGPHPVRKSEGPQLSNYEFTTQGKGVQTPPLTTLPCLLADYAPVVIE